MLLFVYDHLDEKDVGRVDKDREFDKILHTRITNAGYVFEASLKDKPSFRIYLDKYRMGYKEYKDVEDTLIPKLLNLKDKDKRIIRYCYKSRNSSMSINDEVVLDTLLDNISIAFDK